jgi:hypothetical protein
MVDCVASPLLVPINFGSTASLKSHLGTPRNPRFVKMAGRKEWLQYQSRQWRRSIFMPPAPDGRCHTRGGRDKTKAPTELGPSQRDEYSRRDSTAHTVQVQFGFMADLRCADKMQRDAVVHSGSRLRSHPLPVLTKLSPFTQRSPMGSMVIESTGPILGLSASAIAAFLASSTVSKSPVYAASKAGIMPGADGLAK